MKILERVSLGLGLSLLGNAVVWGIYLAVVMVIEDARHGKAAVNLSPHEGWIALPAVASAFVTVVTALYALVLAGEHETR